jgi:hypothetical protein
MAHGKVKTYFLSEEERQQVIEKYGEPIMPLKQRKNVSWDWNKLTLPRYKHLQNKELLTDIEIRRRFQLTAEGLRKLKVEWGIVKK